MATEHSGRLPLRHYGLAAKSAAAVGFPRHVETVHRAGGNGDERELGAAIQLIANARIASYLRRSHGLRVAAVPCTGPDDGTHSNVSTLESSGEVGSATTRETDRLMSSDAWQSILILVFMPGIYSVAPDDFFRRQDPGRARFAKLRMSSLTGPNAGVVLAALAVSQLYYSYATEGTTATVFWGFLVAVGMIFVVVGLAQRDERLIDIPGVIAFVATVFIRDGSEAGLAYMVAAVALLISLSMFRFLFGK